MTTYNYFNGMYEFCFRAVQALKVLGKTGTMDFYEAAAEGFALKVEGMNNEPVEVVSKTITQDQLDTYIACKKFAEEQETQAAWMIRRQTEADHE